MRIINIIKDIQPIRMGVYRAATDTATCLLDNYNVSSELWFPGNDYGNRFSSVTPVSFNNTSIKTLQYLLKERELNPASDIIATHSPWSYQSRWGSHLSAMGFKWIFTAHGTFQPTYLAQKWLKKKIYYELFEKKYLSKVDAIRAISLPEKENLEKKFPGKNIVLVANGCDIIPGMPQQQREKTVFLYMSRLHPQKRVVQLAEAWILSSLNNQAAFQLYIAGPDDGELKKLTPLLRQSNNAVYLGAVYKEEKEQLLNKCNFFILPSIGEGFPVSIVETAGKGLIPVITEGCNFPEIFTNGLAVKTGTEAEQIRSSLEFCAAMDENTRASMSNNIKTFMKAHYSLEIIAAKQYELYKKLLEQHK